MVGEVEVAQVVADWTTDLEVPIPAAAGSRPFLNLFSILSFNQWFSSFQENES